MANHQETALERLTEGILRFQREVYPARQQEYEYAAQNPQKPHTLLITCSDSRIDPEALTQSGPGQIFVTRNIGNMVPPYSDGLGGVSAVIEYAVDALGVQHAVICGHTDCGAMKGVLAEPGKLDAMPAVKDWLHYAGDARSEAASIDGGQASLKTVTERNVLVQMQHLRSHPAVAGAIARGALTVSGWVYDIELGDVRMYSEAEDRFRSLRESATAAQRAVGTAA